ncbi:hypothetical protein AXF42_Ash000114 [Apostasia shenzhenica]|uniref:Uncharacterized protein n=1 Tax=Apostasia shenzhenica TaxID=1088818 RepID=A0A2I0AFF3_9ASPA|nr:hypothetical protein AXF42_Ash000114 [Apostasia shenzhenica]
MASFGHLLLLLILSITTAIGMATNPPPSRVLKWTELPEVSKVYGQLSAQFVCQVMVAWYNHQNAKPFKYAEEIGSLSMSLSMRPMYNGLRICQAYTRVVETTNIWGIVHTYTGRFIATMRFGESNFMSLVVTTLATHSNTPLGFDFHRVIPESFSLRILEIKPIMFGATIKTGLK